MEGEKKARAGGILADDADALVLSQGSAMQFAIFQHEAHEAET